MRIASLLAASVVVIGFGCSDATHPTAPPPASDIAPAVTTPLLATAVFDAASNPIPDPTDRILLDTRTSLQSATSLTSAIAALGSSVAKEGPWAFTANMDGNGTNALRIDWPRRFSEVCKYTNATLAVPLPTPRPARMYIQWKQRLGRTLSGGGVGRVGEFTMGDKCTGLARSEWTALRDEMPRTDAGRVEYQWFGPRPLAPRVTAMVEPNVRAEPVSGSTFSPSERVAMTVTQTLYLQAESAPGARDGVMRLWVDGVLVTDQSNLALGAAGFRRIRFPGRMALPPRQQSEYLWDIVAWEPATTPEDPPTNPAPVATVHVDPASATLGVATTLSLVATLLDANGDTLRDRAVTWTSSAPATVSGGTDGVATGVAAGTATITATSEGQSASATLTVQQTPVASISIAPTTPTIVVGKTVQLTATVRDANGAVLTGRTVTWETSSAGTATVSTTGLVSGVAAGTATITATSEGKSASTDVTVQTPPPAPVASIAVAPKSAAIGIGGTVQLSATTRDASNNVLTGRPVTWQSANTSVASVSSTGLVTGAAAGSVKIWAASESVSDTATITVTAPMPANGIADPTLLPRATGQHPAIGTYGRSLAAGQTYVDPNSGVTVLKLTSASVPSANGGMYHGYSEGGPNISQPWTGTDGQVYYTAKVGGWLVDIRSSTFTSLNWRRVSYGGEIGFAFSLNPATPRIAYVINGKRVDRYNTATNAIENTGGWPWNISAAGTGVDWLQSQLNDTWFVAMIQSNHTVVAFRPSEGTERAFTEGAAGVSIDEPHLDREFPVVYLSTNSNVQNKIVNLETNAYTNPRDTQGINGDDHASPMRGKIVALTWMVNGFVMVDWQGNVSATGAINPSPTDWSGDWHQAAQWVFNNNSEYFVVDQWADTGNNPIYRGMMGFVSLAGDVRLIGATDATGTSYTSGGQPHPTLSPDGKFVMWVSNMNGSARYDTFIARIPVR